MTAIENQDADSKPYITSITLGGFQVFDEPTTIPFGRLTFLFGPNSAGKSAVEDGLLLICNALESSVVGGWNPSSLDRHWRRTNGNPEEFAPVLTMGLTATVPTYLASALESSIDAICDGSASGPAWGHEISVTFRYTFSPDYLEGWSGISSERSYALGIDGCDVLRLEERVRLGVNFSHPLLRGFRLVSDFSALALELPECVSVKDGWIWLRSLHVYLKSQGADRDAILLGLGSEAGGSITKPDNWRETTNKIRPAMDEFLDYFDNLNGVALGNMSIKPHVVRASRNIPSLKDLTHLCTVLELGESSIEKFGLLPDSDSAYNNLAESCLHEQIGGEVSSLKSGRDLLKGVNRALSDHLFLERGYSVAADIRLLLDLDQFGNLSHPEIDEARRLHSLVQIHLVDSEGRRYSFEEVGSGLGYVLPVLCSICDTKTSISMLQQPELHLHPALQAALGDVFIESSSPEHQIIVETHSEHLLLRILKRVRQTAAGKAPIPELRCNPEDVVVAYFDPKPDGTTTVKRLRISEDGEFLDRWPRGFFTERDDELFDE